MASVAAQSNMLKDYAKGTHYHSCSSSFFYWTEGDYPLLIILIKKKLNKQKENKRNKQKEKKEEG
jgi:hypothetical protein